MMKANNGSGNNELRDEWQTPKWLFNKLHKQYNFTFDCCACKENHKCEHWTNCFDENYSFENKMCWMNPPFSKANIMFKHFFKVVSEGIAIYRCDNFETKIWQEVIFPNCSWIFIPSKRIVYEGMEGKGSRFPSALIGLNVDLPLELNGIILKIIKK